MNKEENKLYMQKYQKENVDKLKQYSKQYHATHKNERKKRDEINAEKIKEYQKNYQKENRKKISKYVKNRVKNDPILRLNNNIATAIRISLKGNKNNQKWETLVGYDTQELKSHLEAQFKEGMTWDNHGIGEDKWQIDHRIPISLFNIQGIKSKGFKKCWALDNLQPLWQKENLRKKNKLFQ